ncbi:MAG: hypothetical protein Q4C63_06635 [Eubacteriales bacterium]|nr:hypothetical protein [Eubacteriales bacterium]
MKKYGKGLLLGMLLAAAMSFPALADKLDSGKEAPVNVSLQEDGSAGWENGESDSAKKYTVVLERLKNGNWSTAQTRTTDDTGYEFSVSKTGYYRIKVRAHFYDDTYSPWSQESERVLIDEDDTSGPGVPDDWGYTYSPGPGYDQNGVPITPGSAKPLTNNNGTTAPNSGALTPSENPGSGWVQGTRGWWYKYANGSYPANTWEHIGDKWYFFDAEGYMQIGWVWWNNSWYLCLPDGQMATGWRNVNEKWYYLNPSGVMLTGYQLIDGHTYYLDATGARVQNGYSPDGHLFDANGVMIS